VDRCATPLCRRGRTRHLVSGLLVLEPHADLRIGSGARLPLHELFVTHVDSIPGEIGRRLADDPYHSEPIADFSRSGAGLYGDRHDGVLARRGDEQLTLAFAVERHIFLMGAVDFAGVRVDGEKEGLRVDVSRNEHE
jgi:hypothetical protein